MPRSTIARNSFGSVPYNLAFERRGKLPAFLRSTPCRARMLLIVLLGDPYALPSTTVDSPARSRATISCSTSSEYLCFVYVIPSSLGGWARLPDCRDAFTGRVIRVWGENVVATYDRKGCFLIREEHQGNRQQMICLRYILSAHDAEIFRVSPMFKDAHPALALPVRVTPEPVHPLLAGKADAGYVDIALPFKLLVQRLAHKEAQRVLCPLLWPQSIPLVDSIPDPQDVCQPDARRDWRAVRCRSLPSVPAAGLWSVNAEVLRRLADHGEAAQARHLGGKSVACPASHACDHLPLRVAVPFSEGNDACSSAAVAWGQAKEHHAVGVCIDACVGLFDLPCAEKTGPLLLRGA